MIESEYQRGIELCRMINKYQGPLPKYFLFGKKCKNYIALLKYRVSSPGFWYVTKRYRYNLQPQYVGSPFRQFRLHFVSNETRRYPFLSRVLNDVFQPAGLMESFFQELAKIQGEPEKTELKRLFHAHGMEITGPPLFKQGGLGIRMPSLRPDKYMVHLLN